MNLLLTSIGKRIQLIEHLKTAFRVIGADASMQNPAKHYVDVFYLIPKCREDRYITELLQICEKENVDVLVPLYEPEFPILNQSRERFEEIGTKLMLSTQDVINVCDDKRRTAEFMEKYQLPAPKTYLNVTDIKEDDLPVILKPLDGMGSAGVFRADNKKQLDFFADYVPNPVIQECIKGEEYTIDALCDLQGNPIYIVPRKRIEVRSGEVTKSSTVKDQTIIDLTAKLLEDLNQEGTVMGPMTIQCFKSPDGAIHFIEINARFGGGVPLSIEAGADYAAAMKKMCEKEYQYETTYQMNNDRKPVDMSEQFEELLMMRFDQAVYEPYHSK